MQGKKENEIMQEPDFLVQISVDEFLGHVSVAYFLIQNAVVYFLGQNSVAGLCFTSMI